jgi:dienelactone hydrolase
LPLANSLIRLLAGLVATAALLAESGAQRTTAFLQAINRPKVLARAKLVSLGERDGLATSELTFNTEANVRLTALLQHKPTTRRRRPVVILLHGTGATAESLSSYAKPLAQAGLLAISLTARLHGNGAAAKLYNEALTEAYRAGKGTPFLYDSVWDLERLIDHLATRPDVDRRRIAVLGVSKGGMEVWLAAAADPRIAATVSLVGAQSFQYEIEHDSWQARAAVTQDAFDTAAAFDGSPLNAHFFQKFLDRLAPGLTSRFDGPQMIPLIAPRPLLLVAGELDPRDPLPSVQAIAELTRTAYNRTTTPGNFQLLMQPGTAHAVTPEARTYAIEWLVKQLAP